MYMADLLLGLLSPELGRLARLLAGIRPNQDIQYEYLSRTGFLRKSLFFPNPLQPIPFLIYALP